MNTRWLYVVFGVYGILIGGLAQFDSPFGLSWESYLCGYVIFCLDFMLLKQMYVYLVRNRVFGIRNASFLQVFVGFLKFLVVFGSLYVAIVEMKLDGLGIFLGMFSSLVLVVVFLVYSYHSCKKHR